MILIVCLIQPGPGTRVVLTAGTGYSLLAADTYCSMLAADNYYSVLILTAGIYHGVLTAGTSQCIDSRYLL